MRVAIPRIVIDFAPLWIALDKGLFREGYDAVVPLGTLDLGVDGGKSAIDSLIGDRFRRDGLSSKPGGIFPRHYQALRDGRSGCGLLGKRFRLA